MNGFHEGCQLTMTEVAAILSLAGKGTLFGFQTEDAQSLMADGFWNACCRLMRDSMMTQVNGKFRLSKELAEVMRPVCQAGSALVLTPGSDQHTQVIYYVADTVCAMENTGSGRCVLRAIECGEIASDLVDHVELIFPDHLPEPEEQPPMLTIVVEDSREKLLEGAVLLAERFDITAGIRTGWIRIVEQGLFSWLQWADHGMISCEPLTKEAWSGLLQTL